MKKIGIFIIITLIYTNIFSVLRSQEQIVASWELGSKPGLTQITDSKSNFSLTKNVSFADGTYSGFASAYWPSFDLRDKPWMLEGTFKTFGEANLKMAIAGNRSALSKYTGWDFIMLQDGTIRFLCVDNAEKGKTLSSTSKRFDDGEQHQFTLLWNPERNQISMIIDKKYTYSASCILDLSGDSKRIFYIGAQPTNDGGKVVPFKGELKDFTIKGTNFTSTVDVKSLESMDKEMVTKVSTDATTLWVDAKTLTIEGMGWKTDVTDYTRLPNKFQSKVTPEVWNLSRNSAGISVHFNVTGTTFISGKWTLRGYSNLAHMTPQGVNGLDLYVKLNGKWVWTGIGKPTKDIIQQENSLKGGFSPAKTYECMVYLPLYAGVSELQMGFSPGSKVTPTPTLLKKPIVFYGTSITQGCSASRTGMAFVSMLGRRFDIPMVNLGFSGNGFMDANYSEIMSDIDASAYVIDCLGNMTSFSTQEISDRTLTLVRKLRQLRPSIPIILVEDRTYAYANLSGNPVVNNRRVGLKAAYDILMKETTNLHYVEGEQLLGEDTEATVDGSHPSDLGMYRFFIALEPVISKVLCCKQ